MPDTPTPSPSDPESDDKKLPPLSDTESQSSEIIRPRLKLNRLVIKDTEINPHINPDAEPVPQAVPISEPDPEPPVLEEPPKIIPAQEEEPVEPSPEPQDEKEEEPPPVVEEAPRDDKKAPPANKPRNKRKLIFPLILVCGSLLYGIHIIFDPLGFKSSNNEPAEIPTEVAVDPSREEAPGPAEKRLEISNLPTAGVKPNIQDYLGKIGQQELKVSQSPKGIFINSVFYTEGMPLNPSLGLTIESLPNDTNPNLIISDTEGNAYQIAIP